MAAKAIRSKTAASQHMTQHSQADQPQSRVIVMPGGLWPASRPMASQSQRLLQPARIIT
jgi:hypothetical protein